MDTSKDNHSILDVKKLSVSFDLDGQKLEIIRDVSFYVNKGEAIAVLGESGSGKTISVLSIMGLLPGFIKKKITGKVYYNDGKESRELLSIDEKAWLSVRGRKIGMIFQDPVNALNPIQRCGRQVREAVLLDKTTAKKTAKVKTMELLGKVGLTEPERMYQSFPHELSGGQLQRILIAIALAGNPELLIADEPTSNLDAQTKKEIIDLLKDLQKADGLAIIYISHDLSEVQQIAKRFYLMEGGEIIFSNASKKELKQYFNPPDIALFKEKEDWKNAANPTNSEALIAVKSLSKIFTNRSSFLGIRKSFLTAVDRVSFVVPKGQIVGLVGSSGSGKTTLGRVLLNLEEASGGEVIYQGENILSADEKRWRKLRRNLQIVYQNPYNTLNPRMNILSIVKEPLDVHKLFSGAEERRIKAEEMLEIVGIPGDKFKHYMFQLSGGQRQRIAIARSLILNPEFMVLDECISSLDVHTQYKILELLLELKSNFGLSYLFISHDTGIVQKISDRVLSMENGRVS